MPLDDRTAQWTMGRVLALFVVSPALFVLAAVLAVAGLWPLALVAAAAAVWVIVAPIFGVASRRRPPAQRSATVPADAAPVPAPATDRLGIRESLRLSRDPSQIAAVERDPDGDRFVLVMRDGRRVEGRKSLGESFGGSF